MNNSRLEGIAYCRSAAAFHFCLNCQRLMRRNRIRGERHMTGQQRTKVGVRESELYNKGRQIGQGAVGRVR
jgi:hypothetical protein